MIKPLISLCAFTFCLMDVELVSSDYNFYQMAEGWLRLNPTPANWTAARLQCFREGAVLASPENESLWSAMKTLLIFSQTVVKRGIFTGIHGTYSASKGHYYSIKGTPLSRMAAVWAPGEPDNAGKKKNCLLMLPNGALADVDCSDVYPYVCYRKEKPDAAATKCGSVESGYALDNRTGQCYKFHAEFLNWANAFAACSREGAHLAIMNSATEAQVLKELCSLHVPKVCNCDVVFIGHTEWEQHGLWMTVHGETLKEAGFDKWSRGEPSHAEGKSCKGEKCGGMYKKDGLLDDVSCAKLRPFICEKEPNIY